MELATGMLLMTFLVGIIVGMNLSSIIIKFFMKRGHLPAFLKKNKELLIQLLERSNENCVASGSEPDIELKAEKIKNGE